MHLSLTPRLEEYVRGKVESGLYNNASEVVREALRLLRETEQVKIEALRQALIEGERSGPAEPFDFEAFLAEADAEESGDPPQSR